MYISNFAHFRPNPSRTKYSIMVNTSKYYICINSLNTKTYILDLWTVISCSFTHSPHLGHTLWCRYICMCTLTYLQSNVIYIFIYISSPQTHSFHNFHSKATTHICIDFDVSLMFGFYITHILCDAFVTIMTWPFHHSPGITHIKRTNNCIYSIRHMLIINHALIILFLFRRIHISQLQCL